MKKQKHGKCKSCGKDFIYYEFQTTGTYCSNKCQQYFQRKTVVESGKSIGVRPVRRYLIERKIYKCVMCGNEGEWNNLPLPLQLDHIDGNPKNNNLDNVRWLCPNCHAQTDTWGVKNISDEGRTRLASNTI